MELVGKPRGMEFTLSPRELLEEAENLCKELGEDPKSLLEDD